MGKRAFDILASLLLLAVLWPVLLVVAVCVRVFLGPGVIFSQQRPGLRGQPFTIHKFRTMRPACGADADVACDGQRLTRFGRFLRATSLDELPELINVLAGDMSLVGPRPLLMQYLDRYTPEQARRHEVRPGITGWAQVHGRNALSWEEKFALDVWYVDNRSFLLDLRILARTVGQVFAGRGIAQPGTDTAREFMGGETDPEQTPRNH